MKIKYDSTADAKYVTIKNGKVSATKSISEWLFFDLNKNNEVVGIEILDASKNHIDIYTDGENLQAISLDEDIPEMTFFNKPLLTQERSVEEVLAHV